MSAKFKCPRKTRLVTLAEYNGVPPLASSVLALLPMSNKTELSGKESGPIWAKKPVADVKDG